MGACVVDVRLNASTVKDLKAKFKVHQEEEAYESGHSYSGRLNMCSGLQVFNTHFKTIQEAFDYLEPRCEKWQDAKAARFGEKNEDGTDKWLVVGVCAE